MLAKIVFVLLSVLVMVAVGALADGHDNEMASALAEEGHDHDHDHGHESHDDEAKKGCANNELCKKAFQTVLMAHDICEEEQLPLSLEVGLHVFEDKCEDVLCNSASEPFDPMAVECGTGNDAYEWAGTFDFSDASHTWSMQAVGGKYADPAMRLVFIPTTDTTEGAIKTHEAKAVGMMTGTSCAVTKPGSTSKIEQGGSCFEMTVGSADDSEFTLDTTGISGVVIYAQHVPTEFERNRHYLYDSKSTDIEPVAQIPKPSGGGGGHDHGHDHDHGHGSEPCGCISKEFGFALDCNKTEVIQAAVDYLQDENCKNNKTPECIRNFYIFQAHHDFCAHDDLPAFNEVIFHAMEEDFDTCYIERQYNPKLSMCPPVNCEDKEALKKAVDEMYEHCGEYATTIVKPKDSNGE